MKFKKLLTTVILIFSINTVVQAKSYYERGRTYYIYKKYEKSKEMFLKATERYNDGNSYYFLGEIEKIEGNFEKSKEYLLKAIESKRITKTYLVNSFWNLVVFAEQQRDYSNVVIYSKKMWERTRDKGSLKKVESLIDKILWCDNKEAIEKFKIGIAYQKRRNNDKAIENFKLALAIEPNFLAAKYEIGLIEFNKKNYSIASEYLQPIASAIPFYAEPHMALAKIYTFQKSYSEAIESYSNGMKYGFNSKKTKYFLLLKRGTAYISNQQFEEAIIDLQIAAKIRKKSIQPLIKLATIYIKQKDYDKALRFLHKANRLKPKKSSIEFQIGSIYYKQKNKKFTIYFNRIFNKIKNKKIISSKYFKVLPILATANFNSKKYKQTISIIDTIKPENLTYENSLMKAKSLYRIREYDKAIDTFTNLSLDTSNKVILSKAYWQSGRKEEALKLMKEIIAYNNLEEETKNEKITSKILNKIYAENEEIKIKEDLKIKEEKRLKELEDLRLQEEQLKKESEEKQKRLEELIKIEEQKKIEAENLKRIETEKQKKELEPTNNKTEEPQKKSNKTILGN